MQRRSLIVTVAATSFVAGGITAVATRAVEVQPLLLAKPAPVASTAKKPTKVKPSVPLAKTTAAGPARAASSPTSPPDTASNHHVKLGTNASLGDWRPFPDDCYWNTPIDHIAVDDNSNVYVSSIGIERNLHPDFGPQVSGRFIGIPYVVVSGNTPRTPVQFTYAGESDHDLYPIPPNPPIEGYPNPPEEGDRHLLIFDRDNQRLFELAALRKVGNRWTATSGAIFDTTRKPERPSGWTSADAAGLPIFPALVKWEEVHVHKEIRHALRFTAPKTQRAYVPPASHFASRSKEPTLPPMGLRVRLKASYNISKFSPECQVILKALKKYGMILADNGAPWFIQGAPDPRWDLDNLAELKQVKGSNFEAIQVSHLVK